MSGIWVSFAAKARHPSEFHAFMITVSWTMLPMPCPGEVSERGSQTVLQALPGRGLHRGRGSMAMIAQPVVLVRNSMTENGD